MESKMFQNQLKTLVPCHRSHGLWFALFLTITSAASHAGSSYRLGGDGGVTPVHLACGPYQLIVGATIRHTDVIQSIRFTCRAMKYDGSWGDTSKRTAFSSSSAPSKARSRISRQCPKDSYVSGISGTTQGYKGLFKSLTLHCRTASESGFSRERAGEVTLQASHGGNQVTGMCPGNELAFRVTGKSGWSLDSLKLDCKYNPGEPRPSAPAAQRPEIQVYPPILRRPRYDPQVSEIAGLLNIGQNNFGYNRNPDNPAQHVTGYELCIRLLSGGECLFSREIPTNQHHSAISNTPVNIPVSMQGKAGEWMMRTCTRDGCNSPWASEKFIVLPDKPILRTPVDNTTTAVRSVRFVWNPVASAYAGYQIQIVSKDPDAALKQPQIFNYPKNTTQATIILGKRQYGKQIEWRVYACADYPTMRKECRWSEVRTLNFGKPRLVPGVQPLIRRQS